MIVTNTTLVGYTVINGTWQLQAGLLLGALYTKYSYPNVAFISDGMTPTQEILVRDCLKYCISLHSVLIPITIMAGTTRMDYIGLAVGGSFFGMLFTVYVLVVIA